MHASLLKQSSDSPYLRKSNVENILVVWWINILFRDDFTCESHLMGWRLKSWSLGGTRMFWSEFEAADFRQDLSLHILADKDAAGESIHEKTRREPIHFDSVFPTLLFIEIACRFVWNLKADLSRFLFQNKLVGLRKHFPLITYTLTWRSRRNRIWLAVIFRL